MTGMGIVLPVFSRRFAALGAGPSALGLAMTVFSAVQLIAAPFLGALADRWGRKPLLIASLLAFGLVNLGFIAAQTVTGIILLRGLEGLCGAGLAPAAYGAIDDAAPPLERGRWVGVVSAGAGAGFVLGPAAGGLLYDGWGYSAPFLASAVVAFFGAALGLFQIPETRPAAVPDNAPPPAANAARRFFLPGLHTATDTPGVLIVFLFFEFLLYFAFSFIEPRLFFYYYEVHGWSTGALGVVIGAYGLAVMASQGGMGSFVDRFGRKPPLISGAAATAMFFFGISVTTAFPGIILLSLAGGAGQGLAGLSITAGLLDISRPHRKSRVLGWKAAAAALGGVLGPLVAAGVDPYLTASGIFSTAGILTAASLPVGFFFLSGKPAEGNVQS